MLHKIAVSAIAALFTLAASTVAHADPDLFCGSYLSGGYCPDELTSIASQTLADDLRTCVCYADCSAVCMTYDADEGTYACGIGGDPAFATQGGDADACNACIGAQCGGLFVACYTDH